jgi:centromere protein I
VHSLYGVLFHWIEYETLRPLLCNLLYRMTRPQDVLTWRVHKLYPLSHPS